MMCFVNKATPISYIDSKCCVKKLNSSRNCFIGYLGFISCKCFFITSEQPHTHTHTHTHTNMHTDVCTKVILRNKVRAVQHAPVVILYCIMWFSSHNICIMMLCQPGLLTIRISQCPIMVDEYHLHYT